MKYTGVLFCERHAMNASLNDTTFDDRYRLSGSAAVLGILRNLLESRAPVTVFLGRGPDFFLTQILEADQTGIVFDIGNDAALNNRIERAAGCLCVASHQGITVRFTVPAPVRVTIEGLDAYRAELPNFVLRLQRRETHRVILSVTKPLLLKVVAPQSAVRDGPRKVEIYPLHNICVEGAAFTVPAEMLFRTGDRLSVACAPPGTTGIQCAASVRHVTRIGERSAGKFRVGIRFDNLNGREQAGMQRFVSSVEIAQRALANQ